MAATILHCAIAIDELHSWRRKFYMQTSGGVPVTGISAWTIYRSLPTEAPGVLIAQIPTEVDAVNMPGVYEFKPTLADVSPLVPGDCVFHITDVTPGTAEDTVLFVTITSRSGWVSP